MKAALRCVGLRAAFMLSMGRSTRFSRVVSGPMDHSSARCSRYPLLEERKTPQGWVADCRWARIGDHEQGWQFITAKEIGTLWLRGSFGAADWPYARLVPGEDKAAQNGWNLFLWTLLAFINTPKIIGRRQHMPHRGLEKRLTAALKPVGKFPLHAWTEILLQIASPKDVSAEPSIEAHLTGERALHFCRANIRVRLGQLEIVRAHWRGDASLGIKQSRYKVAA